jgi:hypothetical protein
MTSSVEAAHSPGKTQSEGVCREAPLPSARLAMHNAAMVKLAKGGVVSEKRARTRREVGDRIRMVRKLYDRNRTRYAENYAVEDGRPVHHTTWRLWEEGLYLANPEIMAEFCERTGATMDFIFRGIISGIDEDLKAALFVAYPEMAAAYRAELASRRVLPPPPASPPALGPKPAKEVVPDVPAHARRRSGARMLPEKKSRSL